MINVQSLFWKAFDGENAKPRNLAEQTMTPLPSTTRQWRYIAVPDGLVGPEHYRHVEVPLDITLAEGEVLVEAAFWSVDPYMRINQSRRPTWNAEPHPLNAVQAAAVVGRVRLSRDPALVAGDWVEGPLGWQTHAKAHGSILRRLDPAVAPPSSALGMLGIAGETINSPTHAKPRSSCVAQPMSQGCCSHEDPNC